MRATEGIQLTGTSVDGVPSGIVARALGQDEGAGAAGTIVVDASTLTLTDGARISNGTDGPGQGGTVRVTAESLTLAEQATLATETRGEGAGGNIQVRSEALTIVKGATISAASGGPGAGGTITINADTIDIDGRGSPRLTGVTTTLQVADLGTLLHILHTFGNDLTVTLVSPQGTEITLVDRAGFGANFTQTRLDDLADTPIAGGEAPFTGTFLPQESFNALIGEPATGTWRLRIRDNRPGNQGTLVDWSLELGSAAFEATDVPQPIRDVQSFESTVVVDTPGLVVTRAPFSLGGVKAGDITMRAQTRLQVRNGGALVTTASGRGTGGNITLVAPTLALTGGTIEAETAGKGRAGNITVQAETVAVTEQARITSSSTGTMRNAGAAGTITIRGLSQAPAPAASVTLTNGALLTRAEGDGTGGNITVQATAISLNGATIAATTAGVGDAGEITLTATETFLSTHSTVATAAEAAGGGNITLTGGQLVRLTNSNVTAGAGGEAPDDRGGNVTVNSPFVILDRSRIQANAFVGNGGNITVNTTEAFLADPATCAHQACLDASSQVGVAGTIAVNTPTADLSGVVTPLSQTFTPAVALLRQRCAERLREGEISSFIVAGRDGVPLEPDGLLPDPLAQVPPRDESLSSVGRSPWGQPGYVQSRGWPGHELASVVWDAACGSWLEERETPSLPAH
jgi:subtilisin-like proprotein convertase family protein